MTGQKWAYTWWVDDILLLGNSSQEVAHKMCLLIDKLTDLGIQINRDKTNTEPSTTVTYLGHIIDLTNNCLRPTTDKAQGLTTTAKKLLSGRKFQPKLMASLAGGLIDAARSNAKLLGYPQI